MEITSEDGGSVFQFDGSPDSYVSITHELSFSPTTGFVITAWVQQDAGNSG